MTTSRSFMNLKSGLLRPWPTSAAARSLLACYRDLAVGVRLELRLRLHICPFEAVARLAPETGAVLDLGCGYGLMSLLLANGSARRSIIGMELQAERVEAARRAAGRCDNARFLHADILDADFGQPACIVMNDVLHHIPHTAQIPLLRKCHDSLLAGGALIIKDVDKSIPWKYIWNYVHDFVKNRNLPFYCLDMPILVALLEMIGFQVEASRLDTGYPYPHVLYLCRKL